VVVDAVRAAAAVARAVDLPPEPIRIRDAALKVPFCAEFFIDLGGLRIPRVHRARWRLAVLVGAWMLPCSRAALPQFVGEPVSLPMTGRDLPVAVDPPGSMDGSDFAIERPVCRPDAPPEVPSRT